MKHIYVIAISLTVLAATCLKVQAQDNLLMSTKNVPQAMLTNPAMAPDKSFLAVPLLSGLLTMDAQLPVSYNSIIDKRGGVKYLDNKRVVDLLHGKNLTMVRYNLDLINFGIRIADNDYLNISARLRVHTANQIPGGAAEFILDNPITSFNRNFDFSIGTNTMAWGELGAAYTRKIDANFTVGLRAKFIMGLACAQTNNLQMNVYKGVGDYTISGQGSARFGNLDMASEMDIDKTLTGLGRNMGFGLDVGATYTSDDKKWYASLSVSDFGAIFWDNQNSSELRVKDPNNKFTYNGFGNIMDINKDGGFQPAIDSLYDEIKGVVGIDSLSGVGFTSFLPTTYQAMVSYTIDRNFRHTVNLGFIGTHVYSGKLDYSISAGYAYRTMNRRWQLLANYSYRSNNPFCVGVGVVYTGKAFQAMLMTDNIIAAIAPLSARGVNFRVGINFFMGN